MSILKILRKDEVVKYFYDYISPDSSVMGNQSFSSSFFGNIRFFFVILLIIGNLEEMRTILYVIIQGKTCPTTII